jgi:hypothetical protein
MLLCIAAGAGRSDQDASQIDLARRTARWPRHHQPESG